MSCRPSGSSSRNEKLPGFTSYAPAPFGRSFRATPGAEAAILDLVIAPSDGSTPPVSLDLLGVLVTTSNVDVELSARTGEGQILGNLLYNVSNLLNSGSTAGTLLHLLALLAV